MKLRNNLFLILFNEKENSKWESWKRFALKNNFIYSTISDPIERPILRGLINDKPVSVEAVYEEGKLGSELFLRIKTAIHNPKEIYFLAQDKKVIKSKNGIFQKSLHGICENKKVEEKFIIKSNSESLPTRILNSKTFSNDLTSQDNLSIEIINYELILTSYTCIEINKEFISLLKLFFSFLFAFEEISLDAIMSRIK